MKLLSILALLILMGTGCRIQKSNDEVIAEYKKCQEAGMEAVQNTFGDILCSPPTEQRTEGKIVK